jgi:aryl-alcohol dehydrogenase-like predicted oxidoreductase
MSSTLKHDILRPGRALDERSDQLKKDEATVLKLLQFIGAMSGGKTVTQVALAYLMSKGESSAC